MNNRNFLIVLILVIVIYFNQTTLASLFNKVKGRVQGIVLNVNQAGDGKTQTQSLVTTEVSNELPEPNAKIINSEKANTPGPLETFLYDTINQNTVNELDINIEKIISETNIERIQDNKKVLKENSILNVTAYIKAKDMLDRQYFEHTSPDGKGVSDLANSAGYSYITVGENLALGNFATSADIVTAWMNSPGHRANILNDSYTEIGVGVVSGVYEGRKVWIAVQHFGKPLSDCPTTDSELKNEILREEKEATLMHSELEKQKAVISNIEASSLPNYIQLVQDYNTLVKTYNALIVKTRDQITKYNAQIVKFNQCIEQSAG